MIGKNLFSKNFGEFTIIAKGSKYGYYKVQFHNTKNIDEFRKDAIKKGEIRDCYAVTFCGVGIIGKIKTRGKYKKYYNIWRNMIVRCYKKNKNSYYSKVTVSERWKTFENFYKDVVKIDGWNETEFVKNNLVLDKDIKQRFLTNKIYSLKTCTWTTCKINSKIQDAQQHEFIGISPSGKIYKDTNITNFARNHNLERRQISAVLHKRFKTTLGWNFQYTNEEIV